MPHALRHNLEMDPLTQHQGRMGMPQVMKAEPLEANPLEAGVHDQFPEDPGCCTQPERSSVRRAPIVEIGRPILSP